MYNFKYSLFNLKIFSSVVGFQILELFDYLDLQEYVIGQQLFHYFDFSLNLALLGYKFLYNINTVQDQWIIRTTIKCCFTVSLDTFENFLGSLDLNFSSYPYFLIMSYD